MHVLMIKLPFEYHAEWAAPTQKWQVDALLYMDRKQADQHNRCKARQLDKNQSSITVQVTYVYTISLNLTGLYN
jgi:hypothetical protein